LLAVKVGRTLADLHALLVGSPLVVLALDLQKGHPGVLIATDADFLARLLATLVLGKHVAVGRIEIESGVRHHRAALDLLDGIATRSEAQQAFQPVDRRDELRVDPVHELHLAHLFERHRLVAIQQLL